LITENGIATDDEALRREFIVRHLESLAKALRKGSMLWLPVLDIDGQFRMDAGTEARFGWQRWISALSSGGHDRVSRTSAAYAAKTALS
jgi:beta-glucosidase/6-phospho-beta-glucosidase/beta-galactosidase